MTLETVKSVTRGRVTSLSSVLVCAILANGIATYPLVSGSLGKAMHWGPGLIGAFGAYAAVASYALSPLSGWLVDSYGPRLGILSGALLAFVSYMGLFVLVKQGYEGPFWIPAALYGACGVATTNIVFSYLTAFSNSIPLKYAGASVALPSSLYGLSPIVISAIVTAAVKKTEDNAFAPSSYFFVLGCIYVILMVCGCFAKVIPPSKYEAQEEGLPSSEVIIYEGVHDDDAQVRRNLVEDPSFWFFVATFLLGTGTCEVVMANLGEIARLNNDSLAYRGRLVALLSVTNTLSRVLVGFLADWLSYSRKAQNLEEEPLLHTRHGVFAAVGTRIYIIIATQALLAVTFVIALAARPVPLTVLALVIGVAYGSVNTMSTSIVRCAYPPGDFARVVGWLVLSSAFGTFFISWIVNIIFGTGCTECWRYVFAFCAMCASAAVLVALLMKRFF